MESRDQLFDAYADNELTADQCGALSAWLRASAANVDWFVRESFLHSQLFVQSREKLLHADVMSLPECEADAEGLPLVGLRRPAAARARRGNNRRTVAAVAASLAIIAAGVVWGWLRPSAPPAVGQMTRLTAGAAWSAPDKSSSAGALLHQGQRLHLASGRAQATLVSGAQVVVEGPSVLRVVGENTVWLESGRLAATVPRQAAGFAVETPLGRFVDLGTDFTLDLEPARSGRLYVFEGLVEMQPKIGPVLQVQESRAVEYDAATGKIRRLEFGAAQRLAFEDAPL